MEALTNPYRRMSCQTLRKRLTEILVELEIKIINHFPIKTAMHAGIVWRDTAIESTSHETWNE